MDELKVVKTGEYAPVAKEGYLHVTVEGPSMTALADPEAKQLAWAERLAHGFTNSMAGIDDTLPSFLKPVKEGSKAAKAYLKTFRIHPGL